MALPGQQNNLVESPPDPSAFTNASTLFALGKTTTPVPLEEVFSYQQYKTATGGDSGAMDNGMQVFFKEGGGHAYICTLASAATDSQAIAALDNFTDDLGPGQVSTFGYNGTSSAVALGVMDWAYSGKQKRLPLLDCPDTATIATLTTLAAALRGQSGDRFTGLFWPWDVPPDLVSGVPRTSPPSARIAGNLARNDGKGLTTNDPAAGPNGIAQYVQGLSQPGLSDADRETLTDAGVNVSMIVLNSIRTYGWRTLADPSTDSNWLQLSNSRCIMEIFSLFRVMNENFVFTKMDGFGNNINKYKAAITDVLMGFFSQGDLWGAAAANAFSIDVGPAVNTTASIMAGHLNANVALKTSPFAEEVTLNVAKYPIDEAVPA